MRVGPPFPLFSDSLGSLSCEVVMNHRLGTPRREIVMLAAAFGPVCFRLMAAAQQQGAPHPVNADLALRDVPAGTRRFSAGAPLIARRSPEDFRALSGGQFPEAVI